MFQARSSNRMSDRWILLILVVCGFTPLSSCDEAGSRHEVNTEFADFVGGTGSGERFEVTISRPAGPPVVRVATPEGEVALACSTCHDVRTPNFSNTTTADLDEFHRDLPFGHGSISCLSCHNSDNYDTLRLANQTTVEYTDVMTLCAQCHGQQARSYEHGVHGGMSGYWDLTRGPRTRNNCVDCHDPHQPAFPRMKPTFKPRDRFLTPPEHDEEAGYD